MHDVERAEPVVDFGEQPLDLLRRRHVAPEGKTADLVRQCRELVRIARGEPHLHAFARQQPGERGADAVPGADDQCSLGHASTLHKRVYRTHTRVVGRVKQANAG